MLLDLSSACLVPALSGRARSNRSRIAGFCHALREGAAKGRLGPLVTGDHKIQTEQRDIKLHIGGIEPREGWSILNVSAGAHVDYVGNCNDLSFLQDASCSEIYASHVLEHLAYNGELQTTMKGFYRVLKPGGRLRVSVPDLDILCSMFLDRSLAIADKFQIMRMMYGGRLDEHDIHYTGFNYDFLRELIAINGFKDIQRVQEHNEFNDTSSFSFAERPISLNVTARK